MTNPRPVGGRGAAAFPTIPDGVQVASFTSYPEAQQAVDLLVRAELPVAQVSIIGTELTSVERVTGRMSWGRAAAGGLLSGLWFGMFAGLLFYILSGALTSLLPAALIGAGFGVVFSLVSYSVTRRRRDFTSVMQVVAGRYGILVPAELAGRARQALGGLGSAPAPAAPAAPVGAPAAPGPDAPPAQPPLTYGEALDAARQRERDARAAALAASAAPAAAPEAPAAAPAGADGPSDVAAESAAATEPAPNEPSPNEPAADDAPGGRSER